MQAVPNAKADSKEWQLRVDLAAAFRLAVEFDWHESVGNHFSAAVSEDGSKFLINPKWMHFSRIRASDLQLADGKDQSVLDSPEALDITAFYIHSHLHASVPEAKVLLHCHPPYATALATLQNPTILPIDQNTARFYKRVIIDSQFDGMGDNEDEGTRLASVFGRCKAMIMGNHGVTTCGETVAHAFEELYFLEKACKTLVLAYSTGQPLKVLSDEVAEKTAQSWDDFEGSEARHFEQLKLMLDGRGADYAS
ncbi:MAG: class II aldolase/adducin family protein [Pseudomonadales bacterium]